MAVLNLDGESRAFKFTLSSAREFKAIYGLTLIEAMRENDNGEPRIMDSVVLTQVLWAGLQKTKVSFNRVEKMLQKFLDDGNSLITLYEIIALAAKESGLFGITTSEDETENADPNVTAETESP